MAFRRISLAWIFLWLGRNGIAHFVYCLRSGKPFDEPHTPRLNVWVAEVVDAAYESIRTGRAVPLSK